ncbi:MAG: DUF1134 domain-containing protein [Proteobacteria bacterium]|nr:DUF1134 domain-containing protein [Burkholderiales bacterium]
MQKQIIAAALSLTLAAAFTPAIAAEDKSKSQRTAEDINNAKPSGTIEVEAEQIRLILGGARGRGVLNFQGKTYPFTLRGASAGGVGINKVSATGNVYFLTKAEDFTGTYSAVTAGVTAVKGRGASTFENGKGVVISVRSKTEGVALTLGVGVVEVNFAK